MADYSTLFYRNQMVLHSTSLRVQLHFSKILLSVRVGRDLCVCVLVLAGERQLPVVNQEQGRIRMFHVGEEYSI